jgi:hypothetical protein
VFANILPSNICPENYYKAKYSSNFSSPLPGYLTIKLDQSQNNEKKTVKFDKVIVKFL